jgi:predicted TIM-barrel fold metal-dependent hydrolase
MADQEEILEPDLPIVDPHHHLWEDARPRYLLDELLADIGSGHDVRATVFIECGAMYRADGPEALRPVGEVEFANGVAAMSASGCYGPARVCAGIVGHADLRLGEALEPVLDAMERAGGGRFRGIRQMATHDDQVRVHAFPGLLLDTRFRDGFARLQRRGHRFEAWLYHSQLPELIDLMEAFPEARVVLNHIGGRIGVGTYAAQQDAVKAAWSRDVRALARYPGLHVKLGGLGMPLCGFGFETRERPVSSAELAEAWRPWFETCIAAFGPDRCMFESNFPVDRVSCSYRTLWNAFKRIATGASVDEKAALFSDTAARFYDLAGTG